MDEPKNKFTSPGSSPEVIELHTYNFPAPRRGFSRPEAPYSSELGVMVLPMGLPGTHEIVVPYLVNSPFVRAGIREMKRHGYGLDGDETIFTSWSCKPLRAD